MNSFAEHVNADRRLVLLRLLRASAGYACNEHLLGTMADRMGHAVSADRLRTDLAWLAEQELVTLDTITDLQVAKLTRRGLDVIAGTAHVPGVARPTPGG